ncbi:MAG: P63C domain-containing protein [Candidatus Dadabacteria bacterium]|nr:P63C domain-containing protein [Candidatus Dadabacteria bacterium]
MKEADKKNRSKGGYARAEALTPERRKDIARKAALSRWDSDVPRAEFEGDFKIGEKLISAAVLLNGKRLLFQSTFLKALGRSRSPKAGTGVLSTVDGIPFFLQAEALKPFISEELSQSTTPIFFKLKSGKRMVGYDAELLPQVAEVYLKMRDSCLSEGKKVPSQYQHIVRACDFIMRGLAHVGIVALVDEATGYQEVRDRLALQAILDKYLTDDYAKWTKIFPDEFYKELFRLKGISYPPSAHGQKPSYVGHWTNFIIYSRLEAGVLKELKIKNPRLLSGNRARKYHQHLTRDFGHPELQELLSNTIFLMKGCVDWNDFEWKLNRARPQYGNTLLLDFKEPQN